MADQDFELNELEEDGADAAPAPAPAPAPAAAGDDDGDGDNVPATENEIPDVPRSAQDLEAVYDIPVQVAAVLGKSTMEVQQLLKLGRGAVVELDRKVGEAIDIYVNNRLVARGEVVVLEDRLGITMTEIIKTDRA
jgi:flagellar motor switch protein FliN/FliY